MPTREEIFDFAASSEPIRRLAATLSIRLDPTDTELVDLVRALEADEDEQVQAAARDLLQENGLLLEDSGREFNLLPEDPTVASLVLQSLESAQLRKAKGASTERLPQADDLDKVLNLIALMNRGVRSVSDLSEALEISERQVSYYKAASEFLGLQGDQRLNREPAEVTSKPSKTEGDIQNRLAEITPSQLCLVLLQLSKVCWPFWNLEFRALHGKPDLGIFHSECQLFSEGINSKRGQEGREYSQSTIDRRIQTLDSWGTWVVEKILQYELAWPVSRKFFAVQEVDLHSVIVEVQSSLNQYRRKILSEHESEIRDGILLRNSFSMNPDLEAMRVQSTYESIGEVANLTREAIRLRQKKMMGAVRNSLVRHRQQWEPALKEHFRERDFLDASEMKWAALLKMGLAPKVSDSNDTSLSLKLLLTDVLVGTALEEFGAERSGRNMSIWSKNSGTVWPPDDMFPGIRRGRGRARGKAKVELLRNFVAENGPTHKSVLAKEFETSPAALWDLLQKQEGFVYDHLSKSWNIQGQDPILVRYPSTNDAVIAAVEELGPITFGGLRHWLQEHHPVSASRASQALDSFLIGKNAHGEYDLVSRGATRAQEEEPQIPDQLAVKHDKATLYFVASQNHVRGSGTTIPKWIGWKCNLSASPMKVEFCVRRYPTKVAVSRTSGIVKIGSLRNLVAEVGAKEGCSLALEFDFPNFEVELVHACARCSAA